VASRASGAWTASNCGWTWLAPAHQGDKLWEYAVFVTDVDNPQESIGQPFRDRADAENAFDEFKNKWQLGGFTTQDINRCQTVVRSWALVYNWWSWYCRAANPEGRLEAITSRPLLLAAVGKAASHANQTTLYLTPLYGRANAAQADCQHRRGLAARQGECGAVPGSGPLGLLLRCVGDRLHPSSDHRGCFRGLPALPATVTGAFGLKGHCCWLR